ncbi:unnamed protein product [Choristocarpus tenellus]
MTISSATASSIASMIPPFMFGFAFSCCTKMVSPSSLGMWALTAGMASSIMSFLYLCLSSMAGTSILVSLGWCLLECLATLVSMITHSCFPHQITLCWRAS